MVFWHLTSFSLIKMRFVTRQKALEILSLKCTLLGGSLTCLSRAITAHFWQGNLRKARSLQPSNIATEASDVQSAWLLVRSETVPISWWFPCQKCAVIARERHLSRDPPNKVHFGGSLSMILRLFANPNFIHGNEASTSGYNPFESLFPNPARDQ